MLQPMLKNVARTWNERRILMIARVLRPGPSSKVRATVFAEPRTNGAEFKTPYVTGGHDDERVDATDEAGAPELAEGIAVTLATASAPTATRTKGVEMLTPPD